MALSGRASVFHVVNDTPIYANFLLKGPGAGRGAARAAGTLYGSGSLGGTIKYITK